LIYNPHAIFELSSKPHVKNALELKAETTEDTKRFIYFAIEEEKRGIFK